MSTIEFKSKFKNNRFEFPKKVQLVLEKNKNKSMKVIVLINDSEDNDAVFENATSKNFLNGYADSDSIYDAL